MQYLNGTKFISAIKRAEKETLRRTKAKAIWWSAGRWSYAKLTKFGHPYSARRRPLWYPYDDPAKINVQSGLFISSWKIKNGTMDGNTLQTTLINIAPYSGKLEKGIRGLTVNRPLLMRLIPTVEYWRDRNLSIGVVNALRQI